MCSSCSKTWPLACWEEFGDLIAVLVAACVAASNKEWIKTWWSSSTEDQPKVAVRILIFVCYPCWIAGHASRLPTWRLELQINQGEQPDQQVYTQSRSYLVLSQYVNGYRELGRSKPCISCFLGVILYLRCRGRGVFYLTSVLADASMHPGPEMVMAYPCAIWLSLVLHAAFDLYW